MTPEYRARRIDLGNGSLCCDRSASGMCYEHRKIMEAITVAVEAEREACAKIADSEAKDYSCIASEIACDIAGQIRARSNKSESTTA